MKLVSAARDEGLALTVADVFRNPTFEDMAAIIRVVSMMSTYVSDVDLREYGARHENNAQPTKHDFYERFSLVKASNVDMFLRSSICPKVGVFKGGIADVLPSTDFQSLAVTGAVLESRWMLNYFYLDGEGPVNIPVLKRACFRLVQAFDILRTVFVPAGDRFLQVILRKLRPEFQVYDVDQELDDFTEVLQQRDRDNAPKLGEPFIQFAVAKQRWTARHRIYIRMSHAQYDGVCFPKIMNALQAAYHGDPLPATPSFANYLRASAGTVTSDHYQHWKALLKGSVMTDVVRRTGPNYRRSAGTMKGLKKTIRLPALDHGAITTATIVKGAWAYVLAQISTSSDIVFGHTISGRNPNVEGVEQIIGPCLNVVPVRIQFKPSWDALDLLREIQEQQIANMPYEALGFREIVKHCTEWPDWTNFTTAVQHQNIDRGEGMKLGNQTYKLGVAGTDEDFSDFSILSMPLDEPDMVEISLSYSSTGVITHQFAEQVLEKFCKTAVDFTKDPTAPLLSPVELSRLQNQTIDDRKKISDDLFKSTNLHGLSRPDLLVLSDILSRAWRQVLPNQSENSIPLPLDSNFFELNGDIIGLAQASWFIEQEGFKVRLEDLIDHPTMLGHMAVLSAAGPAGHKSLSKVQTQESPFQTMTPVTPITPTMSEVRPTPLNKSSRTNTFGKAVNLARRIVKKNTRPTAPATPVG
jgi:hypothetical protein